MDYSVNLSQQSDRQLLSNARCQLIDELSSFAQSLTFVDRLSSVTATSLGNDLQDCSMLYSYFLLMEHKPGSLKQQIKEKWERLILSFLKIFSSVCCCILTQYFSSRVIISHGSLPVN